MARTALPLIAAVLLAGCASNPPEVVTETVEVYIPVITRAEPPAELVAPYQPAVLPLFIAPDDERAVAGLTKEGVADFQRLLRSIKARDDAWRAFYLQTED